MASWRVAVVGSRVAHVIVAPLQDVRVVSGVSAITERNQEVVQLDKSCRRNARRPNFHPCAGSSIQHPGGYDRNHAGHRLDVDHVTSRSALAVVASQRASSKWMPPIMDGHFLPDMGRMTLR
jgi:hypothetical protein